MTEYDRNSAGYVKRAHNLHCFCYIWIYFANSTAAATGSMYVYTVILTTCIPIDTYEYLEKRHSYDSDYSG